MKKVYLVTILVCMVASTINAQVLRAVFFNPPGGGGDDGFEYIEISHTPSTTLTNMWFLEIDGDGQNGNINTAISLNTYSTGTNGLLLIRDAATNLAPPPSAATNVVVFNFTPDIQNGSATFMIVTGFTGAVGNDLDPDNDGTLNTTPWTSVQYALGISDGGVTDDLYADDVGGVNLPDIAGFGAEGVVVQDGIPYAIDVSGGSPGPYPVDGAWDATGTRNATLESYTVTPGSTLNPLPVKLLFFSGFKQGNVNILRWTTTSENNNLGFEIQRSADGINFSPIGFVNTQALNGNSTTELNYSFTDNNPAAKQFYRLSQRDVDGNSKISQVILVKGDKPVDIVLSSLFPNPAKNQLNIRIETPERNDVTIIITDQSGRIVLQQEEYVETGSNTIPIDISKITKGAYLVKIVCELGCESAVGRFLKQ